MRLRVTVRASDVVGRYGGEEFLVVLPSTSAPGVRISATKLLQAIRATPSGRQDRPIAVTVGIAAACGENQDTDPEGTLARTDRAL